MAKAKGQSRLKPVRRESGSDARPGRKPKAVSSGKRASLGLKVTPEIKRRLEIAAKSSGRTQSQEAEARIEQSFKQQEQAELFSDLYFGRELSGLLELIGRAMRDAGAHAAANAASAGLGPPNWLDNSYGYAMAAKAASTVIEALRPRAEVRGPKPKSAAEAMLGDAIANGLLNALAHETSPRDFMEEWAGRVRPRLGSLLTRLADFDYSVGAQSVALPSSSSPGLLLYDADDRRLLEEPAQDGETK